MNSETLFDWIGGIEDVFGVLCGVLILAVYNDNTVGIVAISVAMILLFIIGSILYVRYSKMVKEEKEEC